jgi:hypothetical protein
VSYVACTKRTRAPLSVYAQSRERLAVTRQRLRSPFPTTPADCSSTSSRSSSTDSSGRVRPRDYATIEGGASRWTYLILQRRMRSVATMAAEGPLLTLRNGTQGRRDTSRDWMAASPTLHIEPSCSKGTPPTTSGLLIVNRESTERPPASRQSNHSLFRETHPIGGRALRSGCASFRAGSRSAVRLQGFLIRPVRRAHFSTSGQYQIMAVLSFVMGSGKSGWRPRHTWITWLFETPRRSAISAAPTN